MNEINLTYGMRLLISVKPIRYNFMNQIGIVSSETPSEEAEFTVEKYWDKDTDPNSYKVKCVPVDKTGRYGVERYYSSDLKSLIKRGAIKIV